MSYRSPPKQESATSWVRRLRYLVSRLGGTRLQKSQRARFVTFNGQRFKRLILRDSFLAAAIERHLVDFGQSDLVPTFVTRYEHEIWVEYVDGEQLTRGDPMDASDLATFFASVNTRRTSEMPLGDTRFDERLGFDLRFLRKVGVLDEPVYRGLRAAMEELRPAQVRVGFDYTDPVLKNFVRRADNGRICAIDVESLEDGQLIGTGVAKAFSRWMEPHRSTFFAAYCAAGGGDLKSGFAYVELCYLSAYMKMMFMERKWRFLKPEAFQRFLLSDRTSP